jgi:hypothetical protein
MDKYLLAINALIIFSVLVILYFRIFSKTSKVPSDPLSINSDDFTLLE